MTLERILRKYAYCWKETVLMVRRPGLLLPFALLALLQLIVLSCLIFFMNFPLSVFMVDMVRIVGGEAALHYPTYFIRLPYGFRIMALPVSIFGFVLYGWGVFMIADYCAGSLLSARQYLDKIIWNVPSFLTIGIVFTLLGVTVPSVLSLLAGNLEHSATRFTARLFAWLGGLGVKAAFVYAVLFVRIYRDELATAIKMSARFAVRRLALTLMILFTVWALHAPLAYLMAHAGGAAWRSDPDRIAVMLLADVILEACTGFYLFAATTCLAIGAGKRLS
jgi:hypothetical protein